MLNPTTDLSEILVPVLSVTLPSCPIKTLLVASFVLSISNSANCGTLGRTRPSFTALGGTKLTLLTGYHLTTKDPVSAISNVFTSVTLLSLSV